MYHYLNQADLKLASSDSEIHLKIPNVLEHVFRLEATKIHLVCPLGCGGARVNRIQWMGRGM